MTEEQYNALAPYEQNFKTAIECQYSRYPGADGVDTMFRIWKEITNTRMNINRSCSVCILHLIQDVGRLWYAEKAKRVKEQLDKMEDKPEEPKPNKAKKTTKKK